MIAVAMFFVFIGIIIGLVLAVIIACHVKCHSYKRLPPFFTLLIASAVLGIGERRASAQFATGERANALRDLIPIQEIAEHPRLLIYTERDMPRAYQFNLANGGGLNRGTTMTFHAASYNVSADTNERFGNGNREFPWDKPAGTGLARGVVGFKWLILPEQNGKQLPVVWMFGQIDRFSGAQMSTWRFPYGTQIGEVLTLRAPDGEQYPFEMRVRTRAERKWEIDVYRPFPTAKHLERAIVALRPNWDQDPQCREMMRVLRAGRTTRLVAQDSHPVNAVRMVVDELSLPPLPNDLVMDLLTKVEFDNGVEGSFDGRVFAPTTQAAFHVVPQNYKGTIAGSNSTSCMNCHRDVGKNVEDFDSNRDWYGLIRGSDGIFSFNPVRPKTISQNGTVIQPIFYDIPGVIEKYDPARHSAALYQPLEK